MGIEIDMTINILKRKAKVGGAIFIFFYPRLLFSLAVMLLMNYFME